MLTVVLVETNISLPTKTCLPTSLKDGTFGPHLHNDPTVQKWLSQLLLIVSRDDGNDAAGSNNGVNPLLLPTTSSGIIEGSWLFVCAKTWETKQDKRYPNLKRWSNRKRTESFPLSVSCNEYDREIDQEIMGILVLMFNPITCIYFEGRLLHFCLWLTLQDYL